jgi:leucine dehydrogenase
MEITEIRVDGEFEQVVFGEDPTTGYRGIIAIHSTVLGPAVGGTRLWHYANDEEALRDALRLARGMTYKTALAGLPLGGGKAVIIADGSPMDRESIFRSHGRFVERLGGRYITAEDVGTSPADMEYVRLETRHVAGLADRSGDPSLPTARGVFRAILAAARHRWDSENLNGKTVALQGCGHVGYRLAQELHRAGAKLIAADVDENSLRRVAQEFDARTVRPEEIFSALADIFCPCALGGILNDETIPQLRVEIVAGSANNQLLEARHGDALQERGILYAPDYIANAGGVINGGTELLGWEPAYAARKVDEIYDTVLRIFAIARAEGIPTYLAADRLAERRLTSAGIS